MINTGDLIFEAHENYLKEHYSEFKESPVKATLSLLTNEHNFRAYVDQLTESLDPETKTAVALVCQRQRECLLEEANVAADGSAIAYAVNYFPILADIFAEPIVSKVCTVHTVNSGKITVPRIRYKAIIKGYDGSSSEVIIPTATQLIAAPAVSLQLVPGAQNDLFVKAGINSGAYKVNRRFIIFKGIRVIDNDGSSDHTIDISGIFVRPDIRGAFRIETSFTDSAGNEVNIFLSGTVDYNRGIVQFTADFINGTSGHTYNVDYLVCEVRFNPIKTDNGRVIVKMINEAWDIDVDINNDFEIDLTEEDVQNFRDIYNVDAIRNISQAVKAQILLNIDYEVVSLLQGNEGDMAASVTLDYDLFKSGGYAPASVRDLMFAIVPKVLSAARQVRSKYNAMPQYILASQNTAPLLESLQEFYTMLNDNQGAMGSLGKGQEFKKFTILASAACPDNKIYVVYKAPVGQMSRTALLHVIYKPLYIIEETTDSVRRTFVRSRTAVEMPRPDACGYVVLQNYDGLI